MLRPHMFGMGGSEIIVILIVALVFLGPEKLPGAAKSISKGIRDIKKQSRALQTQIENDEQIGGAIRDLKSALRGEELHQPAVKPLKPRVKKELVAADVASVTGAADATTAGAALAIGLPTDENSILGPTTLQVSESSIVSAEASTLPADPDVPTEPPQLDLPPSITLPNTAGEPGDVTEPGGDDDLASLIKPSKDAVAKGS